MEFTVNDMNPLLFIAVHPDPYGVGGIQGGRRRPQAARPQGV
jgi:hypothetical protein